MKMFFRHATAAKALLVIPILLLTSCSTLPMLFPPTPVTGQPSPQPTTDLSTPAATPEPIRVAEITFRVTIPADTPPDGPIQISILDEVTGLALNTQTYTLQAETQNIYSAVIQLPADAVIKYRYTRGSEIPAAEHTSEDRPVRYRLIHTRVSGSVHDIISSWNDTDFSGPTGRIFGQITDSQTGAPVPDLLVTVGGQHAVTRWDGSYLITGLPAGTHNLVTYAKNSAYSIFQQGAVIATDSGTLANFTVDPAPLTKVTFITTLPEGTIPGVPIRIAGNVYQLGNNFSDLSGGISTPAARLPLMSYDSDTGVYMLSVDLPAGAYIRYKYTMGDGFWNAETNMEGQFRLREFIVPDTETLIDDQVENWNSVGNLGTVWFSATSPAGTPRQDTLWLQLNAWGWTEPLPMWRVGPNEWVYLLSAPLNLISEVDFRYCRNAQCEQARDIDSTGPRTFVPGSSFQAFEEELVRWLNFSPLAEQDAPGLPSIEAAPRGQNFLAGIAIADNYHPSWLTFMDKFFSHAGSISVNTVILTPSWTFTQNSPPVFEPVSGRDMPWLDILTVKNIASPTTDVAIYPKPNFEMDENTWWENATRDYAWWLNWFEQYNYFLEHHAVIASNMSASTLILGGDWLNPAIPNGFMPDNFTSGVPADAETWWRDMIAKARTHYQGRLAWSISLPVGVQNAPPFIDAFDDLYVVWNYPLAAKPGESLEKMVSNAEKAMDDILLPFYLRHNKPIIIEINFRSTEGAATPCGLNTNDECELSGLLSLAEQQQAYEAVLRAVNERDWIQGVVTADYFPVVEFRDQSSSIHGKPAESRLSGWFVSWLQSP